MDIRLQEMDIEGIAGLPGFVFFWLLLWLWLWLLMVLAQLVWLLLCCCCCCRSSKLYCMLMAALQDQIRNQLLQVSCAISQFCVLHEARGQSFSACECYSHRYAVALAVEGS